MSKRILMTTLMSGIVFIGVVLTGSGTALAFGGCVDSPENPTWILAGIGAVAAGAPWLRAKIRERRNRRDK
jgi:XrtJ-associated TM-motif-TM protein